MGTPIFFGVSVIIWAATRTAAIDTPSNPAPTIAAVSALVLGVLTFLGGELKDRRQYKYREEIRNLQEKYDDEKKTHLATKRKLARCRRTLARYGEAGDDDAAET